MKEYHKIANLASGIMKILNDRVLTYANNEGPLETRLLRFVPALKESGGGAVAEPVDLFVVAGADHAAFPDGKGRLVHNGTL